MGKAREADKTMRERVKEIVQKIGREADAAAVIDELKRQKAEFSPTTVKQYVSFARVELGFAAPRGTGGGGRKGAGGDPTLSELLNARKLADELKMTPKQLLQLVNAISAFGDTAKLARCLSALDELAAG